MKFNRKALVFLGLAAVLLSVPKAHAQIMSMEAAIEEKDLVAGTKKIDPAKGYIFVHGGTRQMGTFLRQPNDKDLKAYEADWRKALDKAIRRYPSQLAQWQQSVDVAKQLKQPPPAEPVAPTEENFRIGPIGPRLTIGFGPEYVYSKSKDPDYYSYLVEVEPGIYSYYGPVSIIPQGYFGTCYCMGSVRFEVKPGVITNLGNFLTSAPRLDDPSVTGKSKPGVMRIAGAFNVNKVDPLGSQAPLDFTLPTSLAGYRAEQTEFHASGKVDNFFGITITRMPPIPGVLGYDRDTVIDLNVTAASQESAARPDQTASPAGQLSGA